MPTDSPLVGFSSIVTIKFCTVTSKLVRLTVTVPVFVAPSTLTVAISCGFVSKSNNLASATSNSPVLALIFNAPSGV